MNTRNPKGSGSRRGNRASLLRLQRRLYERNRHKIQKYELPVTPDIVGYEDAYRRDVKSFEAVVTLRHLLDEVRTADITIVGDHHTLNLSQKTFMKLARRQRSSRVIIALEFFARAHQDDVDAYLRGRIAERALLKRTNYQQRWPYDIWPHFKPIFELARQRGWPVLALDCERDEQLTLSERDAYMADTIAQRLRETAKPTRVLALVGEYHSAACHLPKALSTLPSLAQKKIVRVHQNCDAIYWKLHEDEGQHDQEVVRLREGAYCILNTPPVVVQQSYLNWIEYQSDTLDYDHLEQDFIHLVRHVARALGVPLQKRLKGIRVYGPDDARFIEEVSELGIGDKLEEMFKGEDAERSWIMPRQGFVYLNNLALNWVGAAAGRLLHCMEQGVNEDDFTDFYARVIHQAFAFFGSKVLNPKRKCNHAPYFRGMLRKVGPNHDVDVQDLESASAILLHKAFEKGRRVSAYPKIFRLDLTARNQLEKALGAMLGERLYYAFVRGHVTRSEMRSFLAFPLAEPERSTALYFMLERRIGRTRIPKRL